ncbi:MAG: LuxR C-terminal-related transcriptional regulator [Oscillochloridaceae bacterium umkhey_bin13]
MPAPILTTKLNPPQLRRHVVLRQPSLDLIFAGLRGGRKLTLISAPAGFGKTTLARAWMEASGLPVAWLALDEGDANPEQFLAYLVAALQTVIAEVGTELLAALATSHPPAPASLLDSLLNELNLNEEPFVLVLDDYHLVASKPVDELLNRLVERMPPALHLLITTREDPTLPLARLRVRNQLTEIRASDLRFSTTEATEFLNQVMGLRLVAADVAVLEQRTEGWAAGLQLAALSLQGQADPAAFIRSFGGTNPFVLDYLLEEVLNKQPLAVQQFLLRTAILNRLSSALCDAVLAAENPSAQATLEGLERANLFVSPLDNERRWYRYHHLFRDLLRQRLAHQHRQETIAAMHLRASLWFEQHGDLSEAFQHALLAEAVERAVALAERAWLAMDEHFQTGVWLGWIKQLPPHRLERRPVLLTQMGWAHMDAGHVEASEACLNAAEASLQHPLEDLLIVEMEQFRILPARIAIARAYNAQVQGRFADTLRYAETALAVIPADQPFLQAQAASILSTSNWASGELTMAYTYMSKFVEASLQAGNLHFALASSVAKAAILVGQGHLRAARQVYQAALELAATHGAEASTAQHQLGLALLDHEMGADAQATQHLHIAFELGQQAPNIDWAYNKRRAQAYLKEAEGDLEAALALWEAAGRAYIRTPIPNLRPVEVMQVRLYLQQNRIAQAQAWAKTSGLALHDAPDYLHEFARLTLAKIVLADAPTPAQIEEVLHMLEAHLRLAQQQKRLRSQLEILMLQAVALHTTGASAQAHVVLEQALQRAEPEGYLRLFVREGEALRSLLADWRARLGTASHPWLGYVETILALFPQPTKTQARLAPIMPRTAELIEPLSERELEVLRLVAQGLSNQAISAQLFVALSTVKGHNLRIFAKLHAKNRTEAVARARSLGLL